MISLLNKTPYLPPEGLWAGATDNRGEQLLDSLLLNQYQNSPNLKEYIMCFVSELDLLFEQIEKVHFGRFLEYATGAQLDVIGIILQQPRSVILPNFWFGFVGAVNAGGMSDEATPTLGGNFQSEEIAEATVTPLDDITYRRLLTAKAMLANRDSIDINTAYIVLSVLINRVPSTFEINDLGVRSAELVVDDNELNDTEIALISYITKYFVPLGINFTIRKV